MAFRRRAKQLPPITSPCSGEGQSECKNDYADHPCLLRYYDNLFEGAAKNTVLGILSSPLSLFTFQSLPDAVETVLISNLTVQVIMFVLQRMSPSIRERLEEILNPSKAENEYDVLPIAKIIMRVSAYSAMVTVGIAGHSLF